jgi:hypothetical protein
MLAPHRRTILKERLALGHLSVGAIRLPLLLFGVLSSALMFTAHSWATADLWMGLEAAMGNAFHFCETNRMDAFIRQPSNTWSNLGYLLVAVLVLTLAVHDLRLPHRQEADNFIVRYPVFTVLFGMSCLLLFMGSFLYHASLTAVFQQMDQVAMYSLVLLVIAINGYRLFPRWRLLKQWRSSHGWAVVLFTLALWYVFSNISELNINRLFPALTAIAFVSSLIYLWMAGTGGHFMRYFKVAYGTLIVGAAVWGLDRSHVLCNPESMVQGHALWHLLTAASALLLYMFYRSEGTISPK